MARQRSLHAFRWGTPMATLRQVDAVRDPRESSAGRQDQDRHDRKADGSHPTSRADASGRDAGRGASPR